MNSDAKALNQNYLTPFDFMGKKRTLARTTMREKRKFLRLFENVDPSKLSDEAFEKEYLPKLKSHLDHLVEPKLTKEEFEDIDDSDVAEIAHAIKVRDLMAEKYTQKEAEDLLASQRHMMVVQVNGMDFQKMAEEQMNESLGTNEEEKAKNTGSQNDSSDTKAKKK